MATEYDVRAVGTGEGPLMTVELMTRSIVVSGAAADPDGASPPTTIRAMTLMAPGEDGLYLPIRMSVATAAAAEYVGDTVAVADPGRFAVGDVIGVVAANTPTADSTTVGQVDAIDLDEGTLTLTGAAQASVAEGDIIIAEDTEQMGGNAVLLRRDVNVLNAASGERISVGAVGVVCGQARLADVIGKAEGDAAAARIKAELRLFDLL